MGAQLALVTRDSEVRFHAQQMGIPVFHNLTHAEESPWEAGQPANVPHHQNPNQHTLEQLRKNIHPHVPKWVDHPVIRIVCFGLSALALFILMIFILPSAKIILAPQVEIQTMKFDLIADPALRVINLTTNNLPTYSKEVIVEGYDMLPASGSMIIPDKAATADLRFTNDSDHSVTLLPGTVVSTTGGDPVQFITLSNNEISIYPNKSIVVPARAIKPGLSGNLPANKLVIFEGNPGQELTVTNPNRTSGGTEAMVPSPINQDLKTLRDRLLSQLKQAAITEMQSILPFDDTLISPTMSMVETIEETSYPLVGEPGNQLELTLRVRFQSQVVSGESIRSLVTTALDSVTPAGYKPEPDSLEIDKITQPVRVPDGTFIWSVTAVRNLGVDIQDYQVLDLVKGVTVAKAKEQLSASLPLMEGVKIVLAPSWWPILPFLTMRIEVTRTDIP
jgi:hypothetical protein